MADYSFAPAPPFMQFEEKTRGGIFDIRAMLGSFIHDFEFNRDYWKLLLLLLAIYILYSIVASLFRLVYGLTRPLLVIGLFMFMWPYIQSVSTALNLDPAFKYIAYIIKNLVYTVANMFMKT